MEGFLGDIPQSLRIPRLELPNGLSEFETMAQISSLAARNRAFADRLTFRGGGVYRRFIPAAVAAGASQTQLFTASPPHPPAGRTGDLSALLQITSLLPPPAAPGVA